MKKMYLSLAAIVFAIAMFSCSQQDVPTNPETVPEDIPIPAVSSGNANPAIIWRQPETINNTSVETFWVMDADGANQTRIYNPNVTSGKKKVIYTFMGPHWSPNGGSICFTQSSSLYKLDVSLVNGVPTASNVMKLLDATANNAGYLDSYWSFGSTNEIIFIVKSNSDNLSRIQAISGNGGTPTTIYTGASGEVLRWITVSPDGSQIAFTKLLSGNRYLVVINRSDGSVAYSIQFNSLLNGIFDIDWSRTSGSTKLSMYAYPLGTTTASVYTMDFTDINTLTWRGNGRAPSWSPDDTKLVFTDLTTNPTNYIKTVELSGGTLTTLGTLFGYTIHWKK
jgi:Tol biopolymer transport system component